jgi:hypothetical protein
VHHLWARAHQQDAETPTCSAGGRQKVLARFLLNFP